MYEFAIEIYTQVAVAAVPIAFVFAVGNLILHTVFSAAFKGRLTL